MSDLTVNNDLSIDDAFDAIMKEKGYSGEPSSSNMAGPDKDTDAGADANTNTNNDDNASTADNTANQAAQDSNVAPDQDQDWKAEAAKWEQKYKSFEGRMAAENARRRDEELQRQQQYLDAIVKANGGPVGQQASDDKAKQLSKFNQLREDYPEFADAVEELLLTKLEETKNSVKQEISSRVDPIVSSIASQQTDSHTKRILDKHPDAKEIHKSEQFAAWVDSLPTFIRSGAVYTINSGSAEEVISLLDQYKSSTTNTNQTNNTAKPTNDKNNTNAVSPEVAAALRSGLVVKTPRSAEPVTNQKTVDKNDFDAAWEDAIKQFGIK